MGKILILANNAGGLYRFRGMLMKALLEQHHEVLASVPHDESVPAIEEMGVQVLETPIDRRGMNPIKDFSLFYAYIRLLMKVKPSLVITYTIKPNVYGGFACKLLGIPYAGNITGLGTAFQGNGILRKMVTAMYRVSLKKAKAVFFENCENESIFLNEKIIREEQACLLNGAGVDLDHFSVCEYPKEEPVRFLFIGRVMKEKGMDELFAAMLKLRAENVNCLLDVVGSFEEQYEPEIRKAEAEGWLRYWGSQSDVRSFIANCHCFVLPSWHEGMANTNLECAASGRPVITSNIHGCLEAVEDGVSGFLCERKNTDDLYRVMKRFAQLPYEQRRAMGLAGRRRMEVIFDKRKVIEETIRHL